MDKALFVENVKKYAKLRGITPSAACRESGAGERLLANVDAGSIPSVAKVQMLADYLGVTTSELLGEEKSSPSAVTDGEAALDRDLISQLVQLSPEDIGKVQAYIQGLLDKR